jgi:type I restriction enzyme S subunit
LTGEQLRRYRFPKPPLEEQKTISAFLDRETAKLDALVAEQRQLIELLEEKRYAVISHAVTKGLKPGVSMIDSGIEWLGHVPAHWNTVRLGALFRETADLGVEGLPVLSVSIHDGVSDREFSEDEQDRKVTRSEDRTKYKRVRPGDLVYNMMRGWQGGFGTVTVSGMVSPAYVVARPIAELRTEFIEHALRTPQAVEELETAFSRSNRFSIEALLGRVQVDQGSASLYGGTKRNIGRHPTRNREVCHAKR